MGCSASRIGRAKRSCQSVDRVHGHAADSPQTSASASSQPNPRHSLTTLAAPPPYSVSEDDAIGPPLKHRDCPPLEDDADWLYLQNPRSSVPLCGSDQKASVGLDCELNRVDGRSENRGDETQRQEPLQACGISPMAEILSEEQERRLRCANLELRQGVALGWSSDEEEGFLFAGNLPPLLRQCALDSYPSVSSKERSDFCHQGASIIFDDSCRVPLEYISANKASSSFNSAAAKIEHFMTSATMIASSDDLSDHELFGTWFSRQQGLDSPDSWNHPHKFASAALHNSYLQCERLHECGMGKDREGDALIPGLPTDLALLCLMRVPFIKYKPVYKLVSKVWRAVLSSNEFYTSRKALGIGETYICFVVHGSRLQLFNLQTNSWFCLPPLPREELLYSPGFHIDPYDWWQIDTVAVCDGSLFVVGGDQADLFSLTPCSKPSDHVHKYDFCSNRWEKVAPMGVSRSHSAAISCGKYIYVAGGRAEAYEGASAEVYDFEKGTWNPISMMNTAMRICVGMEHNGKMYVKGENAGPGSQIEGEVYDPAHETWERMMPGLKAGLARGPAASASSNVFVADWKDSWLKRYVFELDCWEIVGKLPARFSRLVGHLETLYGFTGKIKVDPYSHRLISDAPSEVWKINVTSTSKRVNEIGSSMPGIESPASQNPDSSMKAAKYFQDSKWVCVWHEPKPATKVGGFTWVPCSAHFALLQD